MSSQNNASIPVDLSEMKKVVGGEMDVIKVLVDHVLLELPTKIAEIGSLLAKGDAEQLGRISHALKGSLANFGAEDACKLAHDLEVMARSGELEEADQTLEHLKTELDHITTFFTDPSWQDKI